MHECMYVQQRISWERSSRTRLIDSPGLLSVKLRSGEIETKTHANLSCTQMRSDQIHSPIEQIQGERERVKETNLPYDM